MRNSIVRSSRKFSKLIDTSIFAVIMISCCYIGVFKRIVVNNKESK